MERGLSQRYLYCHPSRSSPASCRRDPDRGRKLSHPGKRTRSSSPPEEEMTAPPSDSDATRYVSTVLTLYLGLPETPLHPSAQDRRCARDLYDRSVPLPVIESAFLLASLRRLLRPADLPPSVSHSIPGLLSTRDRGTAFQSCPR